MFLFLQQLNFQNDGFHKYRVHGLVVSQVVMEVRQVLDIVETAVVWYPTLSSNVTTATSRTVMRRVVWIPELEI